MALTSFTKNLEDARRAIQKLSSLKLGPNASPTFAGLTLTGLTASRLLSSDGNKVLSSVADLTSWIAGVANEIDIADDGDGTITIGIVDPLIVGKGGTGTSSLTDHGILLGSGTSAITPLGVASNGQIPIGSAGADPVLATLTGTANEVIVANGAGSITLSAPDLVKRSEWLQNGFVDATEVSLAWDDASRTLTIDSVGANFRYYHLGILYTETGALTETITDTEGLWVIFIDGGGLVSGIRNPSRAEIDAIWENNCIVAFVYWDAVNNDGRLLPELHGYKMNPATHHYLHNNVGSVYESGMALADFSDVDGDGDQERDLHFSIAAGTFHDEDLTNDMTAIAVGGNMEIWYLDGNAWRWTTETVPGLAISAGNRLAFNDAGTQTEVNGGDLALAHVFAANISLDDGSALKYIIIQGQAQYTNKKNAREGAETEINALIFGTLPLEEIVPVATIILQTNNAYANSIRSRIITIDAGDNYIDWRGSAIKARGGSIADHGALAGLTDDDHIQYPLLVGRTGGQELFGSDTTAEDLILTDNSVDNNSVTVTQTIAAYTHSQVSSGNPHSVTPAELSLVIGTNVQAYDAGLLSLAGLSYVSDSFIKVTATDTYAIRTIAETKTDLSLNNVENTAHSTDAHTMSIDGRDVSVDGTKLDGIEALADVTATNETSHATVLVDADFGSNGLMERTGAGSYGIKVIGTDVQAQGIVLDDLNTLGAPASDGQFIVATGVGAFAYEATTVVRTSLGLGTGDSPQLTGIELGHASDTTLTRASAGNLNIESKLVYRADGTDVPIGDGGTGQSSAQAAINALSTVSGATNEHVLTKDTGTGNAIFKAAAGGGASSRCRAYLSAADQIIPNITNTKIELDGESYDVLGEFAAFKFTCTIAGYYLAVGQIQYDHPTAGKVYFAMIYKNGAPLTQGNVIPGAAENATPKTIDIIYLEVDDEIELYTWQNSGGNQDVKKDSHRTFLVVHEMV